MSEVEGTNKFRQLRIKLTASGQLYEDPDFPATKQSLFPTRPFNKTIEWKRPKDLCSDPRLIIDGVSRFDVQQGELGDCWVLAAIGSLCIHQKLLKKVIWDDQSFVQDYAGIFHFRYWRFGRWVDVVIDDRLPTHDGRLLFTHSVDKNEFWPALLEKAYAKLNGSYENLIGGSAVEAMEDFTGGLCEIFDLKTDVPENLFNIMEKSYERQSMMGCSIMSQTGEGELSNGLIVGHAYTITDVRMVTMDAAHKSAQVPLLRMRNPWGEHEWNGDWSDKSRTWQCIPESERQKIKLSSHEDGEFWMSFKDYLTLFTKLEICHLGPETLDALRDGAKHLKRWESRNEQSAWQKYVNAGGCINNRDSYHVNPQYTVEVVDADDADEDDKGTLIVALMQVGRRKKKQPFLPIGYMIYPLPDNHTGTLQNEFFKYNAPAGRSGGYVNLREITGRHKLKPGKYAIIPSTFQPNKEADFLLRLFTEKPIGASGEIDHPTGAIETGEIKKKKEITTTDENAFKTKFEQVAGEDMEIDPYELKEMMNSTFQKEFSFPGFTDETCRGMVAMRDTDLSGKISFEEFKGLWGELQALKESFKEHDVDKSGELSTFELRTALQDSGYRVSNRTFTAIVMRYSRKDGKIYFDDYIQCGIKLKTMIEAFKKARLTSGLAKFEMDKFIQITMHT